MWRYTTMQNMIEEVTDRFMPRRPDVKLITERSGWKQKDGTYKFSKETRTFLKKLPKEQQDEI